MKHGIKLTAMPAWGKSHDDRLIWDMVAFLQQLPALSSAQSGDTPRRGDPDRQGRDPSGAAVSARTDRARRAWISAVRTLGWAVAVPTHHPAFGAPDRKNAVKGRRVE